MSGADKLVLRLKEANLINKVQFVLNPKFNWK